MRWDYGAKIGKTPFNYSLAYEHGAWEQDGRHSIHTYYYAKLGIDPIRLGTWYVYPSINYSITDETYDHSRVSGMGYDVTALKEFDDRWTTYLGYHLARVTARTVSLILIWIAILKRLQQALAIALVQRTALL